MTKFIKRDATSGRMTEEATTATSAGAADAGKVPNLDASGKLDTSLLPTGVGANAITVPAGEIIAQYELVEIYDDGGTPKARLADASAANKFTAMGWAFNAAAAVDDPVTVYFEGRVAGQTGLVPGGRVYLDTTPGAITTTPLTGAGELHQFIGKAVSTTEFNFEADDPIVLA